MAQALYDEHPLDEYLRESGDRPERVPGAFTSGSDDEPEDSATDSCIELPLSSLLGTFESLRRWSSTVRNVFPSPIDDFAERFKYDLISSSLLSSSVSPSPLAPHSRSRVSSPDRTLPGELKTPQPNAVEKSDQDLKSLSSAFIFIGLAALMNQHRIAALLALVTSFSFVKTSAASAKQNYVNQVFESLEGLKAAGTSWDAAVNDAITIVEREERSVYYTPSSSAQPTPSSALRISLHSTLLTTQHQCDNVRPLLAALASPRELSQLSEMYAPPSPIKPAFSLQPRPPSTPQRKHLSLFENAVPRSPTPRTSVSEKRQTWNGSNISLTGANARTSSVLRKRDRRRSDLTTFMEIQTPSPPVTSVSSSPSPSPLPQVPEADEEEEDENSVDISIDERDLPKDNFGTAALHLRHKRRTSGAEALGLRLTPSRSAPSLRIPPYLSPPSSLSSSRFTAMNTNRHPLSLSALHHALHGALASRRYACAHLLALRFNDDAEDETYWENVRSVTALLSSTLEDAAARLNDALTEADRLSRQDGQPTPEASPKVESNSELADASFPPLGSAEERKTPPRPFKLSMPLDWQSMPSPADGKSFAPAPSGMARFASHVDAITSSMNDARDRLAECVEELRGELTADPSSSSSQGALDVEGAEQAILQTYEQLRRELGHALRECERGKTALLDVFEARRRSTQPPSEPSEEENTVVLPFRHVRKHTGSESSGDSYDKIDIGPYTPDEGSPIFPTLPSLDSVIAARLQSRAGTPLLERDEDDATQHLLLTATSSHLPPPGVEQVFESDSVALASFTRERSKLPKRDSMTGRGLAAHLEDDDAERSASRASWGPGTDVVDELKDVIWKVGERRRKMSSGIPVRIPSIPAFGPSDGSGDYDTTLCTP
ncbi:hypothetical protein DFH11DRAFT_1800759 [Phellopilus nigrolimitatus]|nr:hypothetical protein DFH11DRAFT_1800759 [Phellopilus nigrolimitatus]